MKLKYKTLTLCVLLLAAFAGRVIFLPVRNDSFIHQSAQKGYYDYQGVIHFHSHYSGDATGTFEEIAGVANQQKIDFMIATDHNTLQPLEDKKEGWYQNTLILTGEEISVEEGYLLALDIQYLNRQPKEKTEDIILDIVKQGGIVLIAHPNHPKWRWKGGYDAGISGEEILDFADQWYAASPLTLLSALSYYPFNSSAGFLQLYEKPVETLKRWDRETLKNNFVGIFAPDFHQSVRITGEFKIRFPGADKILPVAHDHILLKTPFSGNLREDKKMLYDAIRKGNLYFSMDLLGDATGFKFSARQKDHTAWMGEQMHAGVQTFFSVTLPPSAMNQKTLIRVLYNGNPVFTSEEKGFNFQSSGGGAYRIEVETRVPTFWGSSRGVVWIYSNPIYLRSSG